MYYFMLCRQIKKGSIIEYNEVSDIHPLEYIKKWNNEEREILILFYEEISFYLYNKYKGVL